jgi:ATP-dependent DNA helicase RecG
MLTKEQLLQLIQTGESDRVEFTESTSKNKVDKFCQAICAFSNDMADHKLPGYLLIGVRDDRSLAGLMVDDKLILTFSQLRDNGNIQPLPNMQVYTVVIDEANAILVVEVMPADMPPVRYKGQIWIRIASQKVIATESQERQLTEKRINHLKNFDGRPCMESDLNDLVPELFLLNYLPKAVDPQIIQDNHRELSLKFASLRFYDLKRGCPTYAGILLFTNNPLFWLPGAYIQFLQIDGNSLSAPIINQKQITGDLLSILRQLDLIIATLIKEYPLPETILREKMIADYPKEALRELLMNAIMHRDYESNTPIRFYWFSDHIEIQNPGCLYGDATPKNFPTVNAYRNPVIAEAMKNLGYVNKYGQGILRAQSSLRDNGNREADFNFGDTFLLVTLFTRSVVYSKGS